MKKRVEASKIKDQITFSDWKKVPNKDSSKNTMISLKVVTTSSFLSFEKQLVKELHTLHQLLYQVHSQYKSFKAAREEASSTPSVATIQTDWSENAKMHQSQEEKSAYCHEYSVSLYPMYI